MVIVYSVATKVNLVNVSHVNQNVLFVIIKDAMSVLIKVCPIMKDIVLDLISIFYQNH